MIQRAGADAQSTSTPSEGITAAGKTTGASSARGRVPAPPVSSVEKHDDTHSTVDNLDDLMRPGWVLTASPADRGGTRLMELRLGRPGMTDVFAVASTVQEARRLLAARLTGPGNS